MSTPTTLPASQTPAQTQAQGHAAHPPAEEDDSYWLVLLNAEAQYALWPVTRPVPEGWQETGLEGGRQDCLAQIRQRWQDMRPRSTR